MILLPSESCDPSALSLGRRVCFLSLCGENSKFLREARETAIMTTEASGGYEAVLLGLTESTLFRVVRFQAPNSAGVRGSFTENFRLLDSDGNPSTPQRREGTKGLHPDTTARINALWAEVCALLERPAITLTEEIRGMGVAVRRYLTWLATIAILTEGLQADPEKKVLVLLDHPENGLHPRLQFEMMRHLELAAGSFEGLDIFIATESPILSAQFEPTERFIIEPAFGEQDEVHLRVRTGSVAKGREPDANLTSSDYGVPSLLGDGGKQAWERYLSLRATVRRNSLIHPLEIGPIMKELTELARAYGFVPPAEENQATREEQVPDWRNPPVLPRSVADNLVGNHAALEAWLRASFAAAFGSDTAIKISIEPAAGPDRVWTARVEPSGPRLHVHNVWAVAQEGALAEANSAISVWVMHKD